MRRSILCILVLVFALTASATVASAQAAPAFQLGFKALADQIPDIVGTPLENEHFNLSNGNSEQHTTKGLMVWRKADNWTAFTNGYMTWINGPNGVQSRLNTERFPWEAPAPATSAPGPSPTPAPAPAAPAPTPTAQPAPPPTPSNQVSGGGVTLTVNSVQKMAQLHQFTTAGPGNTYLVVDVTINNVSRDTAGASDLNFQVKSADGYVYDSSLAGSVLNNNLKTDQVTQGNMVRGTMVFEVPANASGFTLIYKYVNIFDSTALQIGLGQ